MSTKNTISTQENDQFFLYLIKQGILSVSNNGEVYNNQTKRFIGSISGKYYSICYKDNNNKRRIIGVHRLVHTIYNEPIPLGYEINHIDGNKLNNHYTNLEAITTSENIKHAFKLGLQQKKEGEQSRFSKVSDQDVIDIRNKYATGNYSHQILSKEYGITKTAITMILNGKTFKHLPIQKYDHKIDRTIKQNIEINNKIINLHNKGLSSYKIAKQITGISRATIFRIIKEYEQSEKT